MAPSPLLNKYEEITYQKLRSVCDSNEARVYPQVRLADVLRSSGVRDSELDRYALMAHLDFVVVTSANLPLFAVEFDGPSHNSSKQQGRDRKKNAFLALVGLPLLRVNSNWLDERYRRYDLLSYFVDVWFLWESFNEAQENGVVPYEEPFDPTFMQVFDAHGRKTEAWPYHLSYEIRSAIRKLESEGKVIQRSPNHIVCADAEGNNRCLAWMFITPKSGVLVGSGMRTQSFPAIDQSEVLVDICMFDLYESLVSVLRGGGDIKSPNQIFAEIDEFEKRHEFRGCHIGGYSTPLDVDEPSIGPFRRTPKQRR